jgi:uncharacterized protein YndB with AHSA1/START domain
VADAPRRLAFRWAQAGGEETEVAFELTEEAKGTRVTVVETGLTWRSAGMRPLRWGPRLAALESAARAVLA